MLYWRARAWANKMRKFYPSHEHEHEHEPLYEDDSVGENSLRGTRYPMNMPITAHISRLVVRDLMAPQLAAPIFLSLLLSGGSCRESLAGFSPHVSTAIASQAARIPVP